MATLLTIEISPTVVNPSSDNYTSMSAFENDFDLTHGSLDLDTLDIDLDIYIFVDGDYDLNMNANWIVPTRGVNTAIHMNIRFVSKNVNVHLLSAPQNCYIVKERFGGLDGVNYLTNFFDLNSVGNFTTSIDLDLIFITNFFIKSNLILSNNTNLTGCIIDFGINVNFTGGTHRMFKCNINSGGSISGTASMYNCIIESTIPIPGTFSGGFSAIIGQPSSGLPGIGNIRIEYSDFTEYPIPAIGSPVLNRDTINYEFLSDVTIYGIIMPGISSRVIGGVGDIYSSLDDNDGGNVDISDIIYSQDPIKTEYKSSSIDWEVKLFTGDKNLLINGDESTVFMTLTLFNFKYLPDMDEPYWIQVIGDRLSLPSVVLSGTSSDKSLISDYDGITMENDNYKSITDNGETLVPVFVGQQSLNKWLNNNISNVTLSSLGITIGSTLSSEQIGYVPMSSVSLGASYDCGYQFKYWINEEEFIPSVVEVFTFTFPLILSSGGVTNTNPNQEYNLYVNGVSDKKIVFINKTGSYSEISLLNKHIETLATKRVSYRNDYLNINAISDNNGLITYVVNTQWMFEESNTLMFELMTSKSIWLEIDGNKIPVEIKDKKLKYKHRRSGSMGSPSYRFKLEGKNNIINKW